jgi:hypothetical protein
MSYWAVNRLVPISVRTYVKGVRGPLAASILFAGVTLGLRYLLGTTGALITLILASSAGAVLHQRDQIPRGRLLPRRAASPACLPATLASGGRSS